MDNLEFRHVLFKTCWRFHWLICCLSDWLFWCSITDTLGQDTFVYMIMVFPWSIGSCSCKIHWMIMRAMQLIVVHLIIELSSTKHQWYMLHCCCSTRQPMFVVTNWLATNARLPGVLVMQFCLWCFSCKKLLWMSDLHSCAAVQGVL